jgi:hypothetical protein
MDVEWMLNGYWMLFRAGEPYGMGHRKGRLDQGIKCLQQTPCDYSVVALYASLLRTYTYLVIHTYILTYFFGVETRSSAPNVEGSGGLDAMRCTRCEMSFGPRSRRDRRAILLSPNGR